MLETADQISANIVPIQGFDFENLEKSFMSFLTAEQLPSLEDLLEGLIIWAHNTYGVDEVVAAREQYHIDTGKVFPDDEMHLSRTAYFFDHFLFERSIRKERIAENHLLAATPYEIFCSALKKKTSSTSQIADSIVQLGDFRHSLFSIERISLEKLLVQDLISKEKVLIGAKPLETFRALKKGQVIQSFLFRVGQDYQLSPGVILHPPGTGKILRNAVRLMQKGCFFSRQQFLAKSANINMRYIRLKHVDPKVTYNTEFDAYFGSHK